MAALQSLRLSVISAFNIFFTTTLNAEITESRRDHRVESVTMIKPFSAPKAFDDLDHVLAD